MKYRYLFIPTLVVVAIAFMIPSTTWGAGPLQLVPACAGAECTVCDFVALGQSIMTFLVYAAIMLSTLLFVNAGFLYVTSSSNPGNISKAHRIFTNTLVGIILILVSWLFVDFAMKAFYDDSKWGPWNEILCIKGPDALKVPPVTPIGAGNVVVIPQASNVPDDVNRNLLTNTFSVDVNAPSNVTSLTGLQSGTMSMVGDMSRGVCGVMTTQAQKDACKKMVVITGGTENNSIHATEGKYNHVNGYKLDFRDTPEMIKYVQTTFQPAGNRGNGDPIYKKNAGGATTYCVYESTGTAPHFDCTSCPLGTSGCGG